VFSEVGEGDDEDRLGRGKMRVSWKGGEGDDEDREGRGKMRVSWKGGEGDDCGMATLG